MVFHPSFSNCNVPVGLSNVVAIAGGYDHSLAVTVSFTTTPPTPAPQLIQLLGVQFSGDGSVGLKFSGGTNGLAAGDYAVLYTDSLTPPVQWRTNVPVVTVSNGVLQVIDPIGGSGQRFYRLQQ